MTRREVVQLATQREKTNIKLLPNRSHGRIKGHGPQGVGGEQA